MITIETLNWDSPLDKEFKRQKHIVADKQCRHLKGIFLGNKYEADREGEVPYLQPCSMCKICQKELSESDLDLIKKTLKKYEKQ